MKLSRAVILALCAAGCNAHPLASDGGTGGDGAIGQPVAAGLNFAVFGDARPAKPGDTANYPTAIVAGNFAQMQAKGAKFAIGTGDYLFANYETDVTAQLDLFVQGESAFTGPIYHAMGNYECTGATASNCPNLDESPNVRGFM